MAKKQWEAYLETANNDLKHFGVQLRVQGDEENDYALLVDWSDGESEEYASGYVEIDLEELISEAWLDVRVKARRRGDRIILCIVHVDTVGSKDLEPARRKSYHAFELCGSEEQAIRWMNRELPYVLDDCCTMASTEDLISVNAALAEQYDEPMNLNAYASIEDITEETIVKCSEAFCEHHWSHEALADVADELGIDLYDVEKN